MNADKRRYRNKKHGLICYNLNSIKNFYRTYEEIEFVDDYTINRANGSHLWLYWFQGVLSMDNLIKACEKKIHWINFHSFTGNFEYYKDIFEGKLVAKVRKDETGMDKFIEICNNRIERAKTFLQDVATVLGFFGSSLAIVLTLSVLERKEKHVDTFLDIISQYGDLFPVLVFSLIGCVVILFLLLLHYRTSIHAWTAFKEMAILKKCPKKRD